MVDFNASNRPGTCLWCGKKLRHRYHTTWIDTDRWIKPPKVCGFDECSGTFEELEGPIYECTLCGRRIVPSKVRRIARRERLTKLPGIDGKFCTHPCAVDFALAAAETGFRLKKG